MNKLSTPAEHRMVGIMCEIHISPISVFDECCEILQNHGITPDRSSDSMHQLLENQSAEIDKLWNLLLKRYELRWWQTGARRGIEQNIENMIRHIKTYSKWYETGFVLAMEQVEQLEKRLAQNKSVSNTCREAEVDDGNFVYYVVNAGTNIRKPHDGVPIIYATQKDAEDDCRVAYFHREEVISVAAYNRLYGRFMSNESFAAKYP